MYYRSLNAYLRETFGCKVYKLALSAGCTCPNRDGTIGTRGCVFCSGSGEFAASASLSIPEQRAQAKRLVAAKAGPDARYIAYFQDFTNTYAPAEVLRPLFAAAIRQPEVCALSIATRPDCLPPEILSLLAELRAEKPVWVELGLQTIHASTAAYIRRGYPLSVYDEAVRALHARGISVITHQILGLPGETPEMMVETARYIGRSGADGIKLHLLHVLTGTDLAADYAAGEFDPHDLPRRQHGQPHEELRLPHGRGRLAPLSSVRCQSHSRDKGHATRIRPRRGRVLRRPRTVP